MAVRCWTKFGSSMHESIQFYRFLDPLCNQRLSLPQTLKMATQSISPKRPMCPSCSKPARLCLCTRLKNSALDNTVGVTILQHHLEKKHPLNSARIAKLGLKNLHVVSVSDVDFEAQFDISLLDPDPELGLTDKDAERDYFSEIPNQKNTEQDEATNFTDASGEYSFRNDSGVELHRMDDKDSVHNSNYTITTSEAYYQSDRSDLDKYETKLSGTCCYPNGEIINRSGVSAITFTISKRGVLKSLEHIWMHPIQKQISTFDQLLASPAVLDALGKGFVVRKLQKNQLSGSTDFEVWEDFEIKIPKGTVLLFPSEKSVSIEALNLDVKNLIVLDGTWAKTRKIYNENPWLKFLPHIKLELNSLSLYGEVRHQPRAGCLSTIESIVHAMKALGGGVEGLDNLLDVFESMVGDQRRCKYERLNRSSSG